MMNINQVYLHNNNDIKQNTYIGQRRPLAASQNSNYSTQYPAHRGYPSDPFTVD